MIDWENKFLKEVTRINVCTTLKVLVQACRPYINLIRIILI